MTNIKAVLFDFDGTLRDTKDLIYQALDQAFKVHHLKSPTNEELAPYIHHHSHVHQAFAATIKLEDFEAVYMSVVDRLLPSVKMYDGVPDLLNDLHAQGYKLALVTAARSAHQDTKRFQIDTCFETIVGANDITKHKPDPEGINLALQRLEVEADEAVMVGDLATDIQAARAANLKFTVGVTFGFGSRESLEAAGANYLIDNLNELPTVLKGIH